jgi:chromosome segregation protein
LPSAYEGHEDRLAEAAELAREAAAILSQREASLSDVTEDVARLAARHQSVQRLLGDNRTTVAKAEAEAERSHAAVAAAASALDSATEAYEVAEAAQEDALALAEETEAALAAAEEARAETQGREAEARAARSEAEGEANALRAEVAALAKMVDREALSGTQLLDRVTVTPGHEKALGAALADDLRAPQVEGAAKSGWAGLPDYPAPQPLPPGAAPLSDQVIVPEVLRRRISQIGIVPRDQGAALQSLLRPGQRLVSIEGDLWRWDGFRAGSEVAPSAAALRLQQLNRLVALKRDLEDVAARATGARQAHDLLHQRLADLARADQMARDARRAADLRVTEVNRALARAEADRSIAGGKLEAARLAVARFEDEAMAARTAVREAETAAAALPDLETARAGVEQVRTAVEAARIAMMSRRSGHDELRREGEARLRRRQEIAKEVSGWRHRLETAEKRSAELAERRAEAEEDIAEASAAPEEIAIKREELSDAIDSAELRRRTAADALAEAEAQLRAAQTAERDAERAGSEAREARARAEARHDAARGTIEAAADRIREETELSPEALLESLKADPAAMPDAVALETDVNRLKRQREALGAVNLRAEEDAKAVQAEHDTLKAEKDDLEEAIKRLRAGIAGLNREGRERLLTAFEQVNANFSTLFTHLFGGGEARLVLVESDDPLEAGLEIMCQPPGKKLATCRLLSGGEQT